MLVTCPTCGLQYDDVYRWTFCPHNNFRMACVVAGINQEGENQVGIATTVQEADAMIAALKTPKHKKHLN